MDLMLLQCHQWRTTCPGLSLYMPVLWPFGHGCDTCSTGIAPATAALDTYLSILYTIIIFPNLFQISHTYIGEILTGFWTWAVLYIDSLSTPIKSMYSLFINYKLPCYHVIHWRITGDWGWNVHICRQGMHSRNQHVSHHLIINVFVCCRWVLFRYICMDGYVAKPLAVRDLAVIFTMFWILISWIDILSASHEIAVMWLLHSPANDKSILIQVMACCHKAPSPNLNQCLHRLCYHVATMFTWPQWGY